MLANLQTTMSELDTYRDRIVAFEAVKAMDTGRLVTTRQPLQPKSPRTLSGSSEKHRTQSLNAMMDAKPPLSGGIQTANQDMAHDENQTHPPSAHMQTPGDHASYAASLRPQSHPLSPSARKPKSEARDIKCASPGIRNRPPAGRNPMSPVQTSPIPAVLGQSVQDVGTAGFDRFYDARNNLIRRSWPNLTEGEQAGHLCFQNLRT